MTLTIDDADVPTGTVTVRVEVKRTSGAGTLTAQLRRMDTGAVVGNSNAISSGSFQADIFVATLATGAISYGLFLVGSDSTTEGTCIATVKV